MVVEGLGILRRDTDYTELSRPPIYHLYAQIGRYENVIFTYAPFAPESNESLTANLIRPASRIAEGVNGVIANADPKIKELADSYDAGYSTTWHERYNLKRVFVEPGRSSTLFFEPHQRDENLFNGLDLYLTIDQNQQVTRVWFDG